MIIVRIYIYTYVYLFGNPVPIIKGPILGFRVEGKGDLQSSVFAFRLGRQRGANQALELYIYIYIHIYIYNLD